MNTKRILIAVALFAIAACSRQSLLKASLIDNNWRMACSTPTLSSFSRLVGYKS